MTKFNIITHSPPSVLDASDVINNVYFTVDTADLITVHEWITYNPYIVTHALVDDDVIGFFNVIPITTECAELFDRQALKEEDINIEHILPPESLKYAKYAYLAAIAVKDTHKYISRQCAAALISSMSDHFLYGYDIKTLKRIYANPTTFNGNHLVRKLGLEPVIPYKKSLTDNDIYKIDINDKTIEGLNYFSNRYKKFIANNCWASKETQEN